MSFSRACLRAFLLVPSALLSGCLGGRTPLDDASATSGPGADAATEPTSGDGADSVEAAVFGDASDSVAPACGSTTTIDTRPVQADMLIVLDRSESMTWMLDYDDVCAAGEQKCASRADAVVPAVDSLVTDNPDINWGLELFPYPDLPICQVASAPQVGVSSDSAPAIKALLASFTTATSTPTAAALDAATAYLKTVADGRNKAILLATDGYPTCQQRANETVEQMMADAVASAKAAKAAGFPVYVVGIGQGVDNLGSLAEAGGTGHYYPATSTAELNNALKAIAKTFSPTCTFKAETMPVDKGLAAVYVDGSPVVMDESNGWMFDPVDATSATIVLTGEYCRKVLAGATSQVQIVFGCSDR